LLTLLALYHIALEVYWLITKFIDYIVDIINYLQLGLYISAIVFVSSVMDTCGCPTPWQWRFGIISVVLGTLNLIVSSSNFPHISTYVIMYTVVLITFMRLIVFASLLLSAFALIMYMMFHEPDATVSLFLCIVNCSILGSAQLQLVNYLIKGHPWFQIFCRLLRECPLPRE
jgi:hypothetical protein